VSSDITDAIAAAVEQVLVCVRIARVFILSGQSKRYFGRPDAEKRLLRVRLPENDFAGYSEDLQRQYLQVWS
jgi:hypothetical protein